MQIPIKCKKCGLIFSVPFCRSSRAKYCSRKCAEVTLIKKGQRIGKGTEFRTGHTFWLGKKRPDIKGNPQALKPYQQRNEKHPGWVGDKVGYPGLHSWLSRNFIKPSNCEFCKEELPLQWANISFTYRRIREDWMALCRRCHSYYDRENGWGKAIEMFPERRGYR